MLGAPARERGGFGPDIGDGPGSIHLFYVAYDGVVGDDATQSDSYRWFYQGSFTPSSAGTKADFGMSLAHAPASYGDPVPFFVVGAPGEDAIYIIEPDNSWTPGSGLGFPATADPFGPGAVVTKIDGAAVGAIAGDLFGETVHIADLDQDGNVDIVVGAPNTSSVVGSSPIVGNGAVWILPGTGTSTPGPGGSGGSSATPWIDTTQAFRVDPDLDPDNIDVTKNDDLIGGHAGSSLASGQVIGPDEVPVLVTGLPGMRLLEGGVCQHWWLAGFAGSVTTRCEQSPFWQPDFGPHPNIYGVGTSVAVGNFNRHDIRGSTSSDEALIEEVVAGHVGLGAKAVGTRSYVSGTAINDHSYVAAPSAVTGGAVTVFRSDLTEGANIDIGTTFGSRFQAFAHQVQQPGAAQPNARFGRSVIAEEMGTISLFPRLVIGSPKWDGTDGVSTFIDGGRISATRPVAANGFTDPMAGTYDTIDSIDVEVTARVLGGIDGYTLVMSGFTLKLTDGGGTPCTSDTFTGEVTVDIMSEPITLVEGGSMTTKIELRDVAGNEVVTLPTTIAHNSSNKTFLITIDEPTVGGLDPWLTKKCLPVYPSGSAFLLNAFVGAACD